MSSFQVPSPPVASFETKTKAQKAPAPRKLPNRHALLLDEAFLKRVYQANCWFGLVLAVTMGLIGHNFAAPLSSIAGSLSGLLFLKTQELFVARWLRSKTENQGSDSWRWLPTWLLIPGKYAVLIAAILLLRRAGLMNFVTFTAGCLAVQLIMLTMAAGRLLSRRSADGKVGTMLRDVYVAPHKMK